MKLLSVLITALILPASLMAQQASGSITILHTNDLHSKLIGFSPELEYSPLSVGDDYTLGGFARIASIIEKVQKEKRGQALVLDAGDFLMGSFFHLAEAESGFQLRLMRKMGYDAVCLGNHEFDYGPQTLAKIVNNARLRGEIPAITCANLSFDNNNPGSYDLQVLFDSKIIAPYTVFEKDGMKIGVFGIMGYDARDVAPNMKPVVYEDAVKIAKQTSKYLKTTEKVEIVICLSHGGLTKDKNGEYSGEDVKLAENCPYIDVIVGGHSHTYLVQPIWVNDVLIVQAGAYGTNIGRMDLTLNEGKITNCKYQLIQVNDDLQGDPAIFADVEQQKTIINKTILNQMGYQYDEVVVKTGFDLICDEINDPAGSNLGPMVADAIYYYVGRIDPEGTDVALIATGLIRDKIAAGKKGYQSVSDIFRVVSLGEGADGIPGYPLAKVYVTGRELKNVFEVLLIAPKSSSSNYCYYAGVKVYYNPKGGFLNKITRIEIRGNEIDYSKNNTQLYGLVANSYMLEFVSLIKKLTYGLLSVYPKHANGDRVSDMKSAWIDFDKSTPGVQEGKEWFALLSFFESFEDCDGDKIPDIPEHYRKAHINIMEEPTGK